MALVLICYFVPVAWIGHDPHNAMAAGAITGMLAMDIIAAFANP